MKICVDPGHGGGDPGAIGVQPRMLEEKGVALGVAKELAGILRAKGHTVVLTRVSDMFVSLSDRALIANRANADLFVSVHCNAAARPEVEGMETWFFTGSDGGEKVAHAVQASLVQSFKANRNRGVKEGNFAVLRLSKMPAVLVETEFITSPYGLVFLEDKGNHWKLAQAIAHGLLDPALE